MKLKIYSLILVVVFSGCSNTNRLIGAACDSNTCYDHQVRPGFYELTTKSASALASASAMWETRAHELCGASSFINLNRHEIKEFKGSTTAMVGNGIFIPITRSDSTLTGHLLCSSSGISEQDAQKILTSLELARVQAKEEGSKANFDGLGGENCQIASTKDNADSFYQRGLLHLEQRQFSKALTCLRKSTDISSSGPTYRDACLKIGEIYELGQEVPADKAKANEWYKKAGAL